MLVPLLQQLDFQCFVKGYVLDCKTWPFTARKVTFCNAVCRVLEKQGYDSAFLSVMGMVKYYVRLIVINQNNGVFDAVKCSFCNLVYIYNEINVGVVDGRNGNGGQMQARR